MSKNSVANPDAASKQKAEAKKHLFFGVLVTTIIILLIAVMMGIEIYGERLNGELDAPVNAADR